MSVFPRDGLYRASYPALELRGEFGAESPPVMQGHFAIFDSPTEINSLREGNFMETIARGAFRKTFVENRDNIKVLFQHGRDPQIGDKPLGPIAELREDDIGAYYETPLLDTSYNRDLLPGLRAGLYGASFRFQVMRESVNKNPGESASNPRGIPERVVREASVAEYGPVTFPAYAGATAGVRSLTDTIVDVDVLARAGAVVFDEERMKQCQVFISRGVAPEGDAEPTLEPFTAVEPTADPTLEQIASLRAEADALEASLADDSTKIATDGSHVPSEPNHVHETAEVDAVRDESLESETQDAPPVDSAEPSLAHPIRGRRDKSKSYLRKDKPSWQL